ncbi:MAG: ADP-ribosylglycohydrolase family protein [Planctomycetota bacterium]
MKTIKDYEKQVYAGVLGKIIGVYMGRPIEGWLKKAIEAKFGEANRYVHEDQNVSLVVADDDISGTLTFIRALEDSGLYADTPDAFFGKMWLDYLIEERTVLWWGGMGNSTEHTAYLRLKNGYESPASGSMETNGQVVAEQIGAQIFIDAFGMVAPGNPELAAQLARKSASVSHDGEAVHAAVVVAGMVSAAFVEKDMNKLLDIGVGLIPEKSLIAQVHRDVRQWAKQDKDWHKTYERIDKKYGYHRYGGGCHVIPNHAIMVMAWVYAPDDFHQSQIIINTAGWDTDCNAANVGSVMGIKVGLERINERYDYVSPFADRIVIPTADGTRSVSDCLTEALHIARIGRNVMGWPQIEPPKNGVWHHFSLPGSLHGYQSEDSHFATRGNARVKNVAGSTSADSRKLSIQFDVDAGRTARVSTPVIISKFRGGYSTMFTPRLYPGMVVTVKGRTGGIQGNATAVLFARAENKMMDGAGEIVLSKLVRLKAESTLSLSFTIPELGGWPVRDFGIEIKTENQATGELLIDTVTYAQKPAFKLDALPEYELQPGIRLASFAGWISDASFTRGGHTFDKKPLKYIGKNEGIGVLVTGNTDWTDYTFEATYRTHCADRGGIMVRYQGLLRNIALVKTGDKLQLVLRHYGETVLAETKAVWKPEDAHVLKCVCKGKTVTAYCDGKKVLEGIDEFLGRGGAGFIFENGIIGFRDVRVS